jgi:hypothetical protein
MGKGNRNNRKKQQPAAGKAVSEVSADTVAGAEKQEDTAMNDMQKQAVLESSKDETNVLPAKESEEETKQGAVSNIDQKAVAIKAPITEDTTVQD